MSRGRGLVTWVSEVVDDMMGVFHGWWDNDSGTASQSTGAGAGDGVAAGRTVMGSRLEEVVAECPGGAHGLPQWVDALVQVLDAQGLTTEGIYRENGWVGARKTIGAALTLDMLAAHGPVSVVVASDGSSTGSVVVDGAAAAHAQPARLPITITVPCIHTAAALFKEFIRSLPEPLISEPVSHILHTASSTTTAGADAGAGADADADAVWDAVASVSSEAGARLLARLAGHLARVEAAADSNRMERIALQRVFAATLHTSPDVVAILLDLGAADPDPCS